MLPGLQFAWLRPAALALALVGVIPALALWPARHVVKPFWPAPVHELLLAEDDGGARRIFFEGKERVGERPALARTRPVSLWRLELDAGEAVNAWLLGVRPAEGEALLAERPAWLDAARLDAPLPGDVVLVLETAGGERLSVAADQVQRMYRPNGLRPSARLALTVDRIAERWRSPFSQASDGQTQAFR